MPSYDAAVFSATRKKVRDLVPGTAGLSFWADYADDGVSGGKA